MPPIFHKPQSFPPFIDPPINHYKNKIYFKIVKKNRNELGNVAEMKFENQKENMLKAGIRDSRDFINN